MSDVDELIVRGRGMVAEAQPRDVLRLSRDDLSALLDAAQRGREAEREPHVGCRQFADEVQAERDAAAAQRDEWMRFADDWRRRGDRAYRDRDRAAARCVELQSQVETLRGALEWYATDRLYRGHDPDVLYDVGSRARAALDGIDQGDGNA